MLAPLLLLTACTAPPDAPPPPTAEVETAQGAEPPFERVPLHSEIDLTRKLNVGFLIVDGIYNSELVAPYDILHHTIFHTDPLPGMEVFTVAPTLEPVTSFEGLKILPHYTYENHPPIDVLVVPSAEGSMDEDLEDEAMMAWVRKVGSEASFVLSLCDGAFVLAAAGLLEGRSATTFPGDQDRFAEMFPEIDLKRGPSFVHDGPAITSQGGAKSYDPAMYLVDHLYGEKVAVGVGRGMVISWPPG
jgi:transcriptional regulator GlxA family with amidase domain